MTSKTTALCRASLRQSQTVKHLEGLASAGPFPMLKEMNMKLKYTGKEAEVEFRGVTFKKGIAVDLTDNPSLAKKLVALDYFKEAKKRVK